MVSLKLQTLFIFLFSSTSLYINTILWSYKPISRTPSIHNQHGTPQQNPITIYEAVYHTQNTRLRWYLAVDYPWNIQRGSTADTYVPATDVSAVCNPQTSQAPHLPERAPATLLRRYVVAVALRRSLCIV